MYSCVDVRENQNPLKILNGKLHEISAVASYIFDLLIMGKIMLINFFNLISNFLFLGRFLVYGLQIRIRNRN